MWNGGVWKRKKLQKSQCLVFAMNAHILFVSGGIFLCFSCADYPARAKNLPLFIFEEVAQTRARHPHFSICLKRVILKYRVNPIFSRINTKFIVDVMQQRCIETSQSKLCLSFYAHCSTGTVVWMNCTV
jgi:hypothetical protein